MIIIVVILVALAEFGAEYTHENDDPLTCFVIFKWISVMGQLAYIIGIFGARKYLGDSQGFFIYISLFLLIIQGAVLFHLSVNPDMYHGPDRHIYDILTSISIITLIYILTSAITLISLIRSFRKKGEMAKQ